MNRALLKTRENVNIVGDYINITSRKLPTLYLLLFSFAVNTTENIIKRNSTSGNNEHKEQIK